MFPNFNQKIIIGFSLVVIALMGSFPPWLMGSFLDNTNIGYGFLFGKFWVLGSKFYINFFLLGLQLFIVILVSLGLILIFNKHNR